jgi:hypothetical protein
MGIHLMILDLQPRMAHDPHGIHTALWREFQDGDDVYVRGGPFTVASYVGGIEVIAYVEPLALHDTLPEMPLFLDSANYVLVPLEATYTAAYRGVPERWRRVLEA